MLFGMLTERSRLWDSRVLLFCGTCLPSSSDALDVLDMSGASLSRIVACLEKGQASTIEARVAGQSWRPN